MRTYFNDFLNRFSYPDDAKKEILSALDACLDSSRAFAIFDSILKRYEADMKTSFSALLNDMKTVSQIAGIHEYLGNVVMLIALCEQLEINYKKEGLPAELFQDTMVDILYKTIECKLVKGIYGTFVPTWYTKFFSLEIFGMSRLQFEIRNLGKDYSDETITLTPDSTVVSVHIPRTGTPLSHDLVINDYARAAELFCARFSIEKPVVFYCSSWLLFAKHREMLSENSNIIKFMNDFTIISEKLYDNYEQLWRLFDMDYTDVDLLPADSSLRRGYIDLIRKGEKTGTAEGIIVYK